MYQLLQTKKAFAFMCFRQFTGTVLCVFKALLNGFCVLVLLNFEGSQNFVSIIEVLRV